MSDKFENVELDDEDNVMEAHDTEDAERQSNAATGKAGDAVKKQAPMRRADKRNPEPMPKSKAGKISAAHELMQEMTAEELDRVLNMLNGDEAEEATVAEKRNVEINTDFTEDLNALVASEATLSEEFKSKTAVIFEAAVKAKLSEEIDRLEEAYATELAEEVESFKSELVEKVDSYLDYVVETWMEENRLAVESGLRTEIAETFMDKLKDLFTESYIEVPESKVDLVDELAAANEELEEQLNKTVAKSIAIAEELESYKRDAIIREASHNLAQTEIAKLASLVEDIDFEDEETFAAKVKTIKESYFKKTKTATSTITEETEDDDAPEVSGPMAAYLAALRKSSK